MRFRFTGAALAAVALLCAGLAQAADNYQVKDASGATITMRAKESSSIKAVAHTSLNADGTTYINPATSDKQPSLGTAGSASSNVLTVQGIASMTALKVDGSAVTQPISASSLPLPTGAASSALQTTGNGYLSTLAGAVSTGNVNVICTSGCSGGGGGSGYSVLNASTYANSSSYSNVPSGGLVGTSAPTFTNGQASPLSLTTAGGLRVDGSAVTQPVSASALPLPSGAATSALQTTLNGYVDGLEGLVTTGNGSLSTLAGAVSAGNVNVVCTSGCSGGGGGSGYSVLNASTYANTSSYSNVPSGGLVGASAPTFANGQASPLSLTTAGGLRVDGSAVTQPVSGTLTANLGTLNGAATSAKQDSIITTLGSPLQNSGGSVTANLGTLNGAATAALQTTLNGYVDGIEGLIGTTNTSLSTLTGAVSAGNVNVVCTSGCSGGGGSGYSVVNGSTYANSGSYSNVPSGGLVGTSAPTFTNGQASPLSLTTAGSLRVDGSAVTQPIATTVANPTSVLTRPANTTAYSAADAISSNTTAGSVVVPSVTAARISGGSVTLGRVKLNTSATSGMGGVNLQVDLWTVAPTFTNGDNGAYAVATGAAGYIGTATVSLSQYGDGAVGTATIADGPINVKLASGQAIYWTLQTLSTFTPTSGQTFTLTAEAVQN
jgi:hypothetical protein